MKTDISSLQKIAYNLRKNSLLSTTAARSGHPTSCFSAADIAAVLFFKIMQPNDEFILSKGHAAPLLYSVYKELGLLTEAELLTLRQFDSNLEGHPTPRFPYSKAATGSLGQGLSVGNGMAFSTRFSQKKYNVYVLMGDSEMAEGSVWEALEIAAYYKLNNLIGIIDVNRLGQSTETLEGWNTDDYQRKCEAFGWATSVINGHDLQEINDAFENAQNSDKPTMIIAKTIKGYGLPPEIANHPGYHGKAFSQEELPSLLEYLKNSQQPPTHNHNNTLAYAPQKNTCISYTTKLPQPNYTKGAMIPTRKAYGEALKAAGEKTEKIISLDAEVKNSTFAEIFEKQFPHRFIQCFIAEQNMIGMATGLASQNYIPFSSTFAAFLTRAHDQLRMAAISKLPLRIVGSHAGVSIGQDGPSQMGLEDIAMIRTLPDSIILYPCDAVSTYKCVELMANYFDGISYLRTTRSETPVLYGNSEQFALGGYKILHQTDNDRACIIAAGITVHEALKAYEELKKQNVFITVIDCYSIKPLGADQLLAAAQRSGNRIITVEDHYLEGGLGEALSYELRNSNISLTCLAVTKLPRSGTPEELLRYENIDAQAIINKVLHES